MTVVHVELLAVAIVLLYLVVRGRPARGGGARLLLRLLVLGAAAAVAENSCIVLYGFYTYSPDWSLFVGRVPLMVALIWPVVIQSAWDLARGVSGGRAAAGVALAAGLVLADASLIEPVAVQAGLWVWHEPGLFAVPPIGILGWAYFAAACLAILAWVERRGLHPAAELLVLLLAPLACHAALLASWWGLLRWVSQPLPPWPAAVALWLTALVLAWRVLRLRLRARVRLDDMLVRVPPAALFFALLLLCDSPLPLVAYALAFAPPYLVLVPWRALRPHGGDRLP